MIPCDDYSFTDGMQMSIYKEQIDFVSLFFQALLWFVTCFATSVPLNYSARTGRSDLTHLLLTNLSSWFINCSYTQVILP